MLYVYGTYKAHFKAITRVPCLKQQQFYRKREVHFSQTLETVLQLIWFGHAILLVQCTFLISKPKKQPHSCFTFFYSCFTFIHSLGREGGRILYRANVGIRGNSALHNSDTGFSRASTSTVSPNSALLPFRVNTSL